MISLLLNPNCRIPLDPSTGAPVQNAVRGAEYALEKLSKSKQKIILPTPVTAELLTAIGTDAQKYYDLVSKNRLFSVEPFDQKCAVELAILNRTIFLKQDLKNSAEPYQKVKLDRQIVAVLKAHDATAIYTDDKSLANRASLCGIQPIPIADLPLPERDRQLNMHFDSIDPLPEVPNDEFPDSDTAEIKGDQQSDARPDPT